MTELSSRFIQMDDWIFEVKSIRAIRVEHYGQPYNAIANFKFNGDIAYIDGLMTKDNENFSRKDYQIFHQMCQRLGIKEAQFHRFKNNKYHLDTHVITPQQAVTQKLQLVR